MLGGILSLFLLGSPMSYLDFEVKSEEDLEALENDIYNYNYELRIVHGQNEAELFYLENRDVGTFENPANPEDRMIHVFSHSPELPIQDDNKEVQTLIEIYLSHIEKSEYTTQVIERLEGYNEPDEGYEWRVFEIRVQNIESTDPNAGMWLSQGDFSIYVDEDTRVTQDAIMLDASHTAYQLYERNNLTQYYIKQVPVEEPFYLKYQYPDSAESYIIYIDNISEFEMDR